VAFVGLDLDYVAFTVLFSVGLYMVIAKSNLLKKLLGLNVMETAVFAIIVTAGMVDGGDPPVVAAGTTSPYASPLAHAMVITGIVVALSITAVALVLIRQVHAHYGTIEADELKGMT
jgi:multicomponent Na+:H+ antiporter subunit C